MADEERQPLMAGQSRSRGEPAAGGEICQTMGQICPTEGEMCLTGGKMCLFLCFHQMLSVLPQLPTSVINLLTGPMNSYFPYLCTCPCVSPACESSWGPKSI